MAAMAVHSPPSMRDVMGSLYALSSWTILHSYLFLKNELFNASVDCRSGSGRRRHRLCRFKRKESNYMSATCHVIVIILVCVALAESRWFFIRGGRCSDAQHSAVNYLGVKTFFYQGSGSAAFASQNAYFYGNALHDGKRLLLVFGCCCTCSFLFVVVQILMKFICDIM